MLDSEACFRAMASRDRRFEGRFVAAVRTTRVFCRPACAAPLPKARNVLFFAHAAAAEEAGYRPCRRCRPELSPEIRLWPDTSRTVTRATRLISEGALDGNANLKDLAARLGVGERHLRRLFVKHLGTSPVVIAQSRRVHLSRRLLDETKLSITEVALSAGFSSVRRFNEVFKRTFFLSPSRVRSSPQEPKSDEVVLRLPFKPPYDWDSMICFLGERGIPRVESVDSDSYRRSFLIDGVAGYLEVSPVIDQDYVRLRVVAKFPIDLLRIVERVRRLFDLDCDPTYVFEHLTCQRQLASLVKKRPGLRVPGAWDPFEMAVRAILGQQISVSAASTLAGRLATAFGTSVDGKFPGVSFTFPSADQLVDADFSQIGIPKTRARTIAALVEAVLNNPMLLEVGEDLDHAVTALTAIPGIGRWTAHYIAMRALGEPDAFPFRDLGLRKALARNGKTPSDVEVNKQSEAWRPFRAYAVMHLWRSLG